MSFLINQSRIGSSANAATVHHGIFGHCESKRVLRKLLTRNMRYEHKVAAWSSIFRGRIFGGPLYKLRHGLSLRALHILNGNASVYLQSCVKLYHGVDVPSYGRYHDDNAWVGS